MTTNQKQLDMLMEVLRLNKEQGGLLPTHVAHLKGMILSLELKIKRSQLSAV